MSLLALSGLTASYGPLQVLFGVDLSVAEGEVVAMMGRNGMGKTTTIRAIMRMIPTTGGSLTFDSHDLTAHASHQVARLGIGLVPEGRRCFASLTVEENLIASARPGAWDLETVGDLFPRLKERRRQSAATLSGGEQQMLAIGRALMTNPRLLLLDEATEGLAPIIRHEIWQAIARLKTQTSLAIIVVDKSLKELKIIADRAVILEKGKTVWDGAMVQLNPKITDRYLGV